jgi:uncharacterized membrane protein (Fun14 family)
LEIMIGIAGLLLNLLVLGAIVWGMVAAVRAFRRRGVAHDPWAGEHWYMRPATSGDDLLSQLFAALAAILLSTAVLVLARQLGWSSFSLRTAILLGAVLAFAAAYAVRGPILVVIGAVGAYTWVGMWLFQWAPTGPVGSVAAVSGMALLAACLWALGRLHELSIRTRRFGFSYWVSGLVGLVTALFWSSSQFSLAAARTAAAAPVLLGTWRLALGLGTLAVVCAVLLGFWVRRAPKAWPEIAALAVVAVVFFAYATVPPIPATLTAGDLFAGTTPNLTPVGLAWALGMNALLLASLLGLVALGYARREDWLVTLGAILLFGFVLLKYFDWLFTFLDRSLAFVVAGLLLLGVGVLMERGRHYVIKAMEADHEGA